MSNNQLVFETSCFNQQVFNLMSNQQKIEQALNLTRRLVFGPLDQQDQDITISDDLFSFTLQNIQVSPFPTESRKVMKFIETDLLTKFLDKNNFVEVNNYSVIFVSMDDLSYHNFENILNLDYLFDDAKFKLKTVRLLQNKVQTFFIQGSTDTLLSLDKLNYYTIPLNVSQRGGKRLIFHSNQLSYALTKMIDESDFFDKKNFRQVNTVFRLNNFAPGDQKFKSHYDTPFADKSKGLYSKYTMLIYLTGNQKVQNEQPPLQIEDIVFDKIKKNSCIIFDQQFKHEGNAYFDNNKIFIRTELIYKMDGLLYDQKVAQMFNMACYMTKEIGQQQYSADLFNQCVKMRYNIQDVDKDIKRVYLLKRNLEVLYATDGNYYWFPSHIPLQLIGSLIVLDYFNGKVYELKNVNIQSKSIKNIDYSKSQEEIDKFIFDMINSCSFENEKISKDRSNQFQCLEDFIPNQLCEDFTYFKCYCGLGESYTAHDAFQQEKKLAVKKLNDILSQNSVLIFDNMIKINTENIKVQIDSDKFQNEISQGRIIFDEIKLNVKSEINFASCQCEPEDVYEEDVNLFKTKKFHTFILPNIQFQKTQDGIKLSLDIFKNGFIYQSTKTFKQPYTNENQSLMLHQKRVKEKYYSNYRYKQQNDNSLHYETQEEEIACVDNQISKSKNLNDEQISENSFDQESDSLQGICNDSFEQESQEFEVEMIQDEDICNQKQISETKIQYKN
ncbi:hypothetical protein TTHERM_00644660 (macronuclear) [Tetrahymena thermophila SB210]|uniref:Uncharacterized protein n=1 Tax=Tetrahymena thermophila (strain SB210) TaxID=312017 RepID=Q23EW4_TETTS|nr:hypothetical protein TTHERM_00644660 [Tetrahymena thermophila SB210]EAR95141.2 hypothetical protein TTHERM_00644660 [Tetrahymena thermophila SB210]|eukprot:XP_001015386.2 hypothetical protein TTHERM_00644660 [Tetrahymena thermophila SB210]